LNHKKICIRCKVEKPYLAFNGPWKNGDFDKLCKPCRRAYSKEHYAKSKLKKKVAKKSKKCSSCKVKMPSREFAPHAGTSDGLQSYCKKCKREMMRLSSLRGPSNKTSTPKTKHCNICGMTKLARSFYRRSQKSDGLACVCKACRAQQFRDRVVFVTEPTIESKLCGECGEIKTASEFRRDKYKKDGLRSACSECDRHFEKKRYFI